MTIDAFLRHADMTADDFAVMCGITATSLSRIRRGNQNCTRETMRAIIKASGGLISADSLVHGHGSTPAEAEASSGKAAAPSTSDFQPTQDVAA